MHPARNAVVISMLLSWLILTFATAKSSMSFGEFQQYSGSEWIRFAFIYSFALALCSWPWIKTFRLASLESQRDRALGFAVLAVVLCAAFYVPISTAPAEGIGWYVIVCIALVWLSYPLSRLMFGSSK